MRHGSLFSGIGGFDLAAEWMGWENVFHCEWMEFPRKVLDYYWPDADSHVDICKTDFKKYEGTIDIISGGFPCQPFSLAGKRKGTSDERYLWHEMLRAIREIKPKWVIAENVFGITNIDGGMVFEQVCLDLEAEGYEVQPFIIGACSKNAPHRRDRCWFVAFNTKSNRSTEVGGICERENNQSIGVREINRNATDTETTQNTMHSGCLHGRNEQEGTKIWEQRNTCTRDSNGVCISKRDATNTDSNGQHERNGNDEINPSEGGEYAFNDIKQVAMHTNSTMRKGEYIGQKREREFDRSNSRNGINNFQNFPTQSPICSGDDGLPTKLDGITFPKWRNESIKGYGNAIVPQIAYQLFQIIEHDSKNQNT